MIVVKKILVSEVEIVSKCQYKKMAQAYWERQKENKVSYNQQRTVEDNSTGSVRGQVKKEKLNACCVIGK